MLHALLQRATLGGSYTVQCSLTTSNLQMVSYGKYTDEQISRIKARNPDLVGHMRHYDEIVSHSFHRHTARGFIADRGLSNAFRKADFQTIDGSAWGWDDVDIVTPPFKLTKTRMTFPIGGFPPGYHLPQWEPSQNADFEPIPRYVAEKVNGTATKVEVAVVNGTQVVNTVH